MALFEPGTLEKKTFIQPLFIYYRVATTGIRGYFTHRLENGYAYIMRKILGKWAEVDAAGANFAPEIRFELFCRGIGKVHSTPEAITLRLQSTPGCSGVQLAAGGEVTATAPKSSPLMNILFPYSSTIEIEITGQNTALPLPPWVDIVLVGYLIPEKSVSTWGNNGGKNG